LVNLQHIVRATQKFLKRQKIKKCKNVLSAESTEKLTKAFAKRVGDAKQASKKMKTVSKIYTLTIVAGVIFVGYTLWAMTQVVEMLKLANSI